MKNRTDHLPQELYAIIESSIPIVCVDIIPVILDDEGEVDSVGLILRKSPFGPVWCHLGGRVRYGETVGDAIERHVHETLSGAEPIIEIDPQPDYVYQWFPDAVAPRATSLPFGTDPRKHAVALSFAIEVDGDPTPTEKGEALEFEYFAVDDLPRPLWPGCEYLIDRIIDGSDHLDDEHDQQDEYEEVVELATEHAENMSNTENVKSSD